MYSLPYIFIILCLGIAAIAHQSVISNKTKHYITVFCYVLLLFFFGFRGFIADDWQIYYVAFNQCSTNVLSFNLVNTVDAWIFEPGFTWLMFACKSIYNNYFAFQFVCACINIVLLYLFLRKKIENQAFALLLFICFGGYGMMTNMVRNSIAILIFANALQYIDKRKPITYFLLITIAVLFHSSSFTYYPVYFLFRFKYNKWLFLSLFIVGCAFFLSNAKILLPIASIIFGGDGSKLQTAFEAYSTGSLEEGAKLSIGFLERLITGLLIFCYYKKLQTERKDAYLYINCFIAYFLMTFFLKEFFILSVRMSTLFITAYWILWADLVKCFHFKNNRLLFIGFITIYCTLKMIGMTNIITSDYDNVLFGAKSYQERLIIHHRSGDDK